MTGGIPADCTEGAYGRLSTDRCTYGPLDTVTVSIGGRTAGDRRCTVRVCDGDQRPYFEAAVVLKTNRGQVSFQAGGPVGTHYIYLIWPDEPDPRRHTKPLTRRHSRYINFRLEAETGVASGDRDFDELYPATRELMRLGRRQYEVGNGRMVGYTSADTWHFDGIWLRDWVYGIPAYRHWERDMQCGLDRFLEAQSDRGQVPDGIERDGRTWRVGLESDVEYLLVMSVWQTWQATGDDAWLASTMPRLEKALAYATRDRRHWDRRHRLVKRQHSCDTWDFDIDGADDQGATRHVIATCDQSGYVLAFGAMAVMCRHLGQAAKARRWRRTAAAYRRRAAKLLWDGGKFLHHVHLTAIDHDGFDERQQLAMGNTWAMTRGLAGGDQARCILDEYRRRHAATGDAYPWWSLQPGYPDELNYFPSRPFCRQGGYANGGLMPWVGGELCRAAFWFGRSRWGVELLRQYADHVRRTGGAQVWYWPDGTPGFRTTNEVRYAPWGMAEWVCALIEGLAGIRDRSSLLREVEISPRWAAAGRDDARVTSHYAASDAYFSYRCRVRRRQRRVELSFTGSGRKADFAVLLPAGWSPRRLTVNGQPVAVRTRRDEDGTYALFDAVLAGVGSATVECRP